jgi:flavin-dependent dehydrogenase
MNADYVILGGGVAGLCAARRLIELGIQPLVIEAGSYPSHKVCGEFISSSGVALAFQFTNIKFHFSNSSWKPFTYNP